jgi:REP element-mobilizing transposase RayT
MAHTLTKILIHCVFSTKQRKAFLSDPISDRLNRYMAGIATHHQMHLLRSGGTADHRHLLLQFRPAMNVSEGVQVIKANSSGWLKDTFPELGTFAWQAGYAAFSVGLSSVESVVGYIDSQAEHHRTATFEEELVAMLQRAGIEYDPRHLWD